MISRIGRILTIVGLMIFVLAGCLRSASTEEASITAGQARSTNTPLPTFTFTPGPTATAAVVVQTVAVTTIIEVTSTPEPTSAVFVAQAAPEQDQGLIPASSQSDEPDDTPLELPGANEPVVEPVQQQQQQPPTPTLDPIFAEATGFVETATQQSIDRTATAIGPVDALPTFTPTFDPAFGPTPTPTPSPSPTFVPGSNCVHEVRTGENVYRLSLRYGVLVNDIARANGLSDANVIIVGDMLTIPNCGTTGVTPPPTSTPRASATPVGGGGTTDNTVTNPSVGGRTYVVQQGETLFEISLRFGVTVEGIMAANPDITDPNFVLMNTEIFVPGS